MNNKKHTLTWLDMLKGFAIFLVVFGHTITVSLRESDSKYMLLYFLIYFFHTRTLFYLSGYIMGFKKDTYLKKNTLKFIETKFKRLIIPYFSILILTYIGINILSINNFFGSLWKQYGFGSVSIVNWLYGVISGNNIMNQHLWYVYVLFVLSIVLFFIMKKQMNTKITIFIFICLFLFQQFTNNDTFYVLNRCFDYGVFFMLGFIDKINEKKYKISLSNFISIIYMIVFAFLKSKGIHGIYDNPLFILIFSYKIICTLVTIFKKVSNKYSNTIVTFMGEHSYPIYLFHHPFFSIGLTTIIFTKIHFLPFFSLFIITIVCVCCSLVIEYILNLSFLKKIKLLFLN